MPEYDFSALYACYPAAIEGMPQTFTSHEFILKLAGENQVQYIEALYHYSHKLHRGHPAPFLMVHAALAQHLNTFPDLIRQINPSIPSRDIFGQANNCAEWEKVK